MAPSLRALRWLLVGLAALLPLVAVTLPPSTMSWLRSDYAWIGRPLLFLDSTSTAGIDLTHVVLFGGITWCVACLWPRVAWWRLAGLVLALGTLTEVLQYGVPGRTPRLGDLVDDVLGAGVGLLLAWPLRRWAQARHEVGRAKRGRIAQGEADHDEVRGQRGGHSSDTP